MNPMDSLFDSMDCLLGRYEPYGLFELYRLFLF